MISIGNSEIKKLNNFWNQCLFHPTDAVEDPWGRRILDRIAEDKAIKTIRIYTMFEDIVYIGEDGELCYDFRLSDLRLDYMIEKGYDLLLAYAGVPDCIATTSENKTSVSNGKTRYKGKMWNTAPPKDFGQWEEICYEYTKHIVERYGIERVSKWRMQCFNEPDIPAFFLSEYNWDVEPTMKYRLPLYCQMYAAFERGIRRVSDEIKIGGPALALSFEFLGGWLDYVKENNLKLDFISVHNYGGSPHQTPYKVQKNMDRHARHVETIKAHGFDHLPLLLDEWGMCSGGFLNREHCPALMARENEVYSAYFAKLIHSFAYSDYKVDMLCICLSGQHEMTEDFSGFRNFFTLNFIAKPIYNCYILAHKLKENLLSAECGENIFAMPTKDKDGNYSVMISYSDEEFTENIPGIEEKVCFAEDIIGRKVTVWCIDKNHTNPFTKWTAAGEPEIEGKFLLELRKEGKLKPLAEFKAETNEIPLSLSANATYLITVE